MNLMLNSNKEKEQLLDKIFSMEKKNKMEK